MTTRSAAWWWIVRPWPTAIAATAPPHSTDAELASGKLDLRVFVDRGSVEVYVNGGHQVLSSYSYASEGPRAIKLVAESGSLKVDSLKLHHMKSIGLE